MIFVKDSTGVLSRRPHYEAEELDNLFEDLVFSFLKNEYGEIRLPLKTEDLEKIVEQKTSDLDTCVDLSTEGKGVEGLTVFYANRLPAVKISDKFLDPRLSNRHRSTLAHEFGHVILHPDLWEASESSSGETNQSEHIIRSMRRDIENPNYSDWLEWQAYYAGGATIMPKSSVRKMVAEVQDLIRYYGPIRTHSSSGIGLISRCRKNFHVSSAAAKVRLLQLNHLVDVELSHLPTY